MNQVIFLLLFFLLNKSSFIYLFSLFSIYSFFYRYSRKHCSLSDQETGIQCWVWVELLWIHCYSQWMYLTCLQHRVQMDTSMRLYPFPCREHLLTLKEEYCELWDERGDETSIQTPHQLIQSMYCHITNIYKRYHKTPKSVIFHNRVGKARVMRSSPNCAQLLISLTLWHKHSLISIG